MQNGPALLTEINNIFPANKTEHDIRLALLAYLPTDDRPDAHLSYFEENFSEETIQDYEAGVEFLTKYNLMP